MLSPYPVSGTLWSVPEKPWAELNCLAILKKAYQLKEIYQEHKLVQYDNSWHEFALLILCKKNAIN
jgi:hypothetical protein